MTQNNEESRPSVGVCSVGGSKFSPTADARDQWENLLEQATPIPNRLILEAFRDDPEGFLRLAGLMALAFFNRTNKVIVDGKPVYVQEAVPLMEQANEKLIQQLEYAEFSGDAPLSHIRERWAQESYKIEIPEE